MNAPTLELTVARHCTPALCLTCRRLEDAPIGWTMPLQKVVAILDEKAGITNKVELRGCDFFDHPDAAAIIRHAARHYEITLRVNGLRIAENLHLVHKLREIVFEIDAATPATYGLIHGCSSSTFWKVLSNLKLLRKIRDDEKGAFRLVGSFRKDPANLYEDLRAEGLYLELGADEVEILA